MEAEGDTDSKEGSRDRSLVCGGKVFLFLKKKKKKDRR